MPAVWKCSLIKLQKLGTRTKDEECYPCNIEKKLRFSGWKKNQGRSNQRKQATPTGRSDPSKERQGSPPTRTGTSALPPPTEILAMEAHTFSSTTFLQKWRTPIIMRTRKLYRVYQKIHTYFVLQFHYKIEIFNISFMWIYRDISSFLYVGVISTIFSV